MSISFGVVETACEIVKPSSISTLVSSLNITVTSYEPGIASTIWKVPGCTITPLNIPIPENVPVALIVP